MAPALQIANMGKGLMDDSAKVGLTYACATFSSVLSAGIIAIAVAGEQVGMEDRGVGFVLPGLNDGTCVAVLLLLLPAPGY